MNETNDELNLSHKSDMMVWAFSRTRQLGGYKTPL